MALAAGASPASTPIALTTRAAKIAVQKPTWKWAVTMPSSVLPISSICRIITPKRMPLIPATRVRTILSEMASDSATEARFMTGPQKEGSDSL